MMVSEKQHSGPLPSGEYFERVKKVVPGAGLRIIALAEGALKAQTGAEERRDALQARGLTYAFILAVVILATGVLLVETGKDIAGYVTLISAAAYLIAVFVNGRLSEQRRSIDDNNDDDERDALPP